MGRWKNTDIVNCCVDIGTYSYYIAVRYHDDRIEVLPDWDGVLGTPAAIGFEDGDPDKVLIGVAAESYAGVAPQHVARVIKAALYDHGDIPLLRDSKKGKEWSAKELETLFLKRIKEHVEAVTEKHLVGALITSPACTSSPYRETLKAAAEAAGMKFLGLVHEPVGALLGHLNGRVDKGTYLVLDSGGGTTDVSAMRAKSSTEFRVSASAGRNNAGGNELKGLMMSIGTQVMEAKGVRLDPQKDLREIVQMDRVFEDGKKQLSSVEQVPLIWPAHGQLFDVTITRSEYETVIAPVLSEIRALIMDVLTTANLTPDQIDGVLLAGGASRTPAIRNLVVEIFGKDRLREGVDKDQAVCRGGALVIGQKMKTLIEQGDHALKAVAPDYALNCTTHLTDVIGTALGVRAENLSTGREDLAVIVPKNASLPCEHTKRFSIKGQDGTFIDKVTIHVLQGEPGTCADEAFELAAFDLENLPPGPLNGRVEITFSVDSDGIVTLRAKDRHTHQEIAEQVDTKGAMSKA